MKIVLEKLCWEESTERSNRNVPRSRSDFGGWREEKGGKDATKAIDYVTHFFYKKHLINLMLCHEFVTSFTSEKIITCHSNH